MSSIAKVPLTVAGADALKAELHRLKTIERPAVILAIGEARAHGDLSENAEYDAAKHKQSFIEGRINELENKLASAQIIAQSNVAGRGLVRVGTTHGVNRFGVDGFVRESIEDFQFGIVLAALNPLARCSAARLRRVMDCM